MFLRKVSTVVEEKQEQKTYLERVMWVLKMSNRAKGSFRGAEYSQFVSAKP